MLPLARQLFLLLLSIPQTKKILRHQYLVRLSPAPDVDTSYMRTSGPGSTYNTPDTVAVVVSSTSLNVNAKDHRSGH